MGRTRGVERWRSWWCGSAQREGILSISMLIPFAFFTFAIPCGVLLIDGFLITGSMRCYFLSTSQHHRVQTHHHKTVCILYYQGCKGSIRQIQICYPNSSENVSNIRRFGYMCMLFCRFSEVLGDCCFLGHLDEDTFKGLSSHPEYTDS